MYTVNSIGSLGGLETIAYAINGRGQVAGSSRLPSEARHAVVWSPGSGILDLGTVGGANSEALGINSSGMLCGFSDTADGVQHAVTWVNNSINDFTDDYGQAVGINDSGDSGCWLTQPGPGGTQAVLMHQNAGLILLGANGLTSSASGINNSGQVIGQSEIAQNGQTHAILWTPTSASTAVSLDLQTLGGNASMGLAINNVGQAVGTSLGSDDEWHPFIWSASQGMKLLDSAAPPAMTPYAMNDVGEVVGEFTGADARPRAFVSSGGTTTDLNTLIPPDSGWALWTARGINIQGQIVGDGMLNGARSGFVLTPIRFTPPPPPPCARLLQQYDELEADLAAALAANRTVGPIKNEERVHLLLVAIAGLVAEMRGAGCLTGVLPPPGGTLPKA
jgi:probable HAF family extracellular repeat protein